MISKVVRNVLIGLVAIAGIGSAGTLALTPTAGGSQQNESVPFSIGWQFSLSTSLTVTELGYFDVGGDGLADAHDVGIYTLADNSLVVSGTVAAGTVDPLDQGYRVISVSTTLAPGNYVMAGYNPGRTPDDFFGGFSSATPVSGLTYVTALGNISGSLSLPTLVQGGENIGEFGPNFFVAATSSVPEPGTLLFAGSAFVALGLAGRMRRRR